MGFNSSFENDVLHKLQATIEEVKNTLGDPMQNAVWCHVRNRRAPGQAFGLLQISKISDECLPTDIVGAISSDLNTSDTFRRQLIQLEVGHLSTMKVS